MSARSELLREAIRGLLTGEAAPAGRRIVYHGSPHVFDRFSTARIGTGEGAQVYGHGLYFAENPAVAMDYREKLADPLLDASYGTGGQFHERGTPEWKMLATVHNGGMREARRLLGEYQAALARREPYIMEMGGEDFVRRAEQTLASVRGRKDVQLSSGRLYEADIPEGPYLDWDAPLGEQPPEVRAAFGWTPEDEMAHRELQRQDTDSLLAALTSDADFDRGPESALRRLKQQRPSLGEPGSEAYQRGLRRRGSTWLDPNAKVLAAYSRELNERGLKGVQYLDQGSRASGAGTRNYVIFNDSDVNMRALRAALLALGAGGSGYAALSQSQETA